MVTGRDDLLSFFQAAVWGSLIPELGNLLLRVACTITFPWMQQQANQSSSRITVPANPMNPPKPNLAGQSQDHDIFMSSACGCGSKTG